MQPGFVFFKKLNYIIRYGETVIMKKITVVLPTFNEAENIVEMIRNILALNIPGMNIIVADDDSGTGLNSRCWKILQEMTGYAFSIIRRRTA